ncbi:uncharacterized protein LOC111101544 isoform X1 [Crassostrea virginica]
MAVSKLLLCLCLGLVAGQMMTDSGVTDDSTDNMAGQTDNVNLPETTAVMEDTTTVAAPTTTEACYDKLGDECFRYKDTDCVGPYEAWARSNCSLRCGYCPQRLPCVDELSYCQEFGRDVCQQEQYGQYMRKNCRKFCDICKAPTDYLVSSTTSTTTPEPTSPTTPYNPVSEWCQDKLRCWYYPDEKCTGGYESWARENCPFRCGYCPNFKPPCVDLDTNCAAFKDGSCTNLTYRAYMRENCRSFCNECYYPGENLTSNLPPTPVFVDTTPAVTSTAKAPETGSTQQTPTLTPSTGTAGPVTAPPNTLPTGEDCKDAIDCSSYSSESCVGVFSSWAIRNCPRTCGYCTASTECQDYEECGKLPEDLCNNPTYRKVVETSCRKFCKLCTAVVAPTKPAVLGTTEAMMVPTKPASEGATTEQTTDDVTMATNQAGSEQPGSEVVSMPTKLAASDKTTTTSAATATGKTQHAHPTHSSHTPNPHGHGHTLPTLFPPTPTGDACKDNPSVNCSQYSQRSCEGAYKAWAIVNCPVHCGYCAAPCNKDFKMAIPDCCSKLCSCPDNRLTGTVKDASAGNAPMANVSVYLRDCDDCEPVTSTDETGSYVIEGVCVKGSVAKFEFPGYTSLLKDIENPKNDGEFVADGNMSPLVETSSSASVTSQ